MKITLIPEENFDKKSKDTIFLLVHIAEIELKKFEIRIPKEIVFYDMINPFIKKIINQVKAYNLSENQASEFIKASLNAGTYGTFDIENNQIVEMNFNPYFKTFYPAVLFLRMIIHESLHLYLYSKLNKDIYSQKFKFKKGKYSGIRKIIQLDEGFAGVMTDKILESFNFNAIKDLPIYSGLNSPPDYLSEVEGLNIKKFNLSFEKIYQKNSKKGYKLIKRKLNAEKSINKLNLTISFIQNEVDKLFLKHKRDIS